MILLDYEGGGRRVSNAKILMTQYVLCIVYTTSTLSEKSFLGIALNLPLRVRHG